MKHENQTPDEQMRLTLKLVKDTIYNHGLCTKLFTYLKHAERLLTENAETDQRDQYDALSIFIDLMKRAQSKSLNMKDLRYVYTEIRDVLK